MQYALVIQLTVFTLTGNKRFCHVFKRFFYIFHTF